MQNMLAPKDGNKEVVTGCRHAACLLFAKCLTACLRECDGWADGLFSPYVCVTVRMLTAAISFTNNIQ